MTNRQLMGVDKKFKKLIQSISKNENISEREVTRKLFDEMTGRTIFEKKNSKGRTKNVFG